MKSMIRRVAWVALGAAFVFAAGCKQTDADSEAIAADGEEAVASQQQSVSLGAITFPITAATPEDAASETASAPPRLWPASCVTRTQDATNARVVHVTYADCTGPFGLVHLNGSETVTFSVNSDGTLHAAIDDDGNLTANGKPVQHSAAADITVAGEIRDVVWKGAWTKIADNGETVAHSSDLTITVDLGADCSTVSGDGVTNVGTREIDTSYDAVKVCLNDQGFEGCPSGSVVHTRKATGKSVGIAFDGTATANVTGPNGGEFDVPLVCTP